MGYKIIISHDHEEAEEFMNWLRERGHDAMIGRDTGNYVDGRWTSSDADANDVLRQMWDECNNARTER